MFWKTIRFAKRNPGEYPKGTCDITCDLLVAKLLGQYSKEQRAHEARERELKEAEENAEKKKKEAELKALQEEIAQHELFLEGKVKMVSELLSNLTDADKEAVSRTFLAMSSSSECCVAIRQSRCLPVLIGLIHGEGSSKGVREQASRALHSVVLHGAENKRGRREATVHKLIEQLRRHCDRLREGPPPDADEVAAATHGAALLMKFSFNEEYRRAMAELGAPHTLAQLLVADDRAQAGRVPTLSAECVAVRRYAAMALTNLTFRDTATKALLCSLPAFVGALVAQLDSPNEDLCQVTASILRNLSWRADTFIKKVLRDMESVVMLMKTALRVQKESTLKSVLSAIWNLSAHSNLNKVDICNVDGAIEYLVKMLNYQAPSGTLVVVENVGGIFRNVSNLIAVRDDYRAIIRNYNCLYVLLHQLSSPSLTVVSNACGTLWNLSARCAEDQSTLISLGAIQMLRSLVASPNRMISVACAAALKNLQNARLDANVVVDESPGDGTLLVRKRRALEQEINARLRSDAERLAQRTRTSVACPEHSFSGRNLVWRRIDDFAHPLHGDPKTMSDEAAAAKNSVRFRFTNDNGCAEDAELADEKELRQQLLTAPLSASAKGIWQLRSEKAPLIGAPPPYLIGCAEPGAKEGLRNKCDDGYDSCGGDYLEMDRDDGLRFPAQGLVDLERSEMMVADLLNQCIVLGMQNMKNITDRLKEQNYLDAIGPPPFLAEAEEFSEHGTVRNEKFSPKLKRNRSKERYNTQNVKLSPTRSEGVKKSTPTKDRRGTEKDRFKTRALNKGDFEEISKSQEAGSPTLSKKNAAADDSGAQSDGEKSSKQKTNSAIPIVRSKLPSTKGPASIKASAIGELPTIGLHRQNTFNRDELSNIPVRKNSFKNQSSLRISTVNTQEASSPPLRSTLQSRIKEPSPVVGRMLNSMAEKSPDFAKSRWTSASEGNLNPSSALKLAKGLGSSPASNKLAPTGLPVRRESSLRTTTRVAYGK